MAVTRSPKYPNFSLRAAVKQAEKVFRADRRNVIDRLVAAKHMGYSSLSGPADKSIATLLQYGLLERVGKGEVRISQTAVDILHPDSPRQKAEALAKAAYSPELFKALKARFPEGVSAESLRSYLVRENFLDRAISPITKAFSETIAFLEQSGASDSGGVEADEAEESIPSDDEDPMEAATTIAPPAPRTAPQTIQADFTRPLAPNEREWMRGDLSRGASYRVLVTGDVGAKEIGKLIKLLEAQRAVLEDEDDEEA